jgi:hypothetical protein
MIICPNCKHQEIDGTIFCTQCGGQLMSAPVIETHKINTSEARLKIKGDTVPFRATPPEAPDAWISLHILDSGQIISLAERTEFTLGRISEGQPIMPDVDLTPFNAYANGVSRLHAVLKQGSESAVIMDLGSSNGTYVNGNRLTSHVEEPINHGDVVHLGKLKIQLLFGKKV